MLKTKAPTLKEQSDPSYRVFLDVPEKIQQAFGGREWFWRKGCTKVHRVGLFLGIGWELGLDVRRASNNPDITGVRIVQAQGPIRRDTYTMLFLHREPAPEDHISASVQDRIILTRAGLKLGQLKEFYAETIGEHAA